MCVCVCVCVYRDTCAWHIQIFNSTILTVKVQVLVILPKNTFSLKLKTEILIKILLCL